MNYLKYIKNKKLIFVVSVSLPLLVSACNTMEGAGVDIQKAGKSLENSAERNKGSSEPCPTCPHKHTRSNKV